MIGYLRGELSKEKTGELEEQYFQSDALHEELLVAEEELIDACVHGELPADRIPRFEARYLATGEDRERVAFARSIAKHISEHPASLMRAA